MPDAAIDVLLSAGELRELLAGDTRAGLARSPKALRARWVWDARASERRRLIEAAANLGAGPFRRFRRIILPLSRDGILAGSTLVFLLVVGLYAMPQLLGGPSDTMFAATIGQVFGRAGDSWPLGSAFSIILIVAALAYVGLFAALVGRGPARGSAS